jgi:hypothetical protein
MEIEACCICRPRATAGRAHAEPGSPASRKRISPPRVSPLRLPRRGSGGSGSEDDAGLGVATQALRLEPRARTPPTPTPAAALLVHERPVARPPSRERERPPSRTPRNPGSTYLPLLSLGSRPASRDAQLESRDDLLELAPPEVVLPRGARRQPR